MAFEIPKTKYSGQIREITLGKGDKAVTVGGESCYPFYLFEGDMPHLPRIAMEVYDCPPEEWAPAALEPFAGVTGDPVAWAKKCIEDYGAEMICLQLVSTDPNGLDRGAEEAAQVVKQVAGAIDVPLIVWGTANHDKDSEVLRLVAEACQDKRLVIGPVEEGDHKKIGASALAQQDDKLQFPIICNVAKEVWKTKEAHIPTEEDPTLGDAGKRGILMEAMSAMILLLAGGDVMIMRHPEAIRLVREMITELAAS